MVNVDTGSSSELDNRNRWKNGTSRILPGERVVSSVKYTLYLTVTVFRSARRVVASTESVIGFLGYMNTTRITRKLNRVEPTKFSCILLKMNLLDQTL